jgi:hypothetical protein
LRYKARKHCFRLKWYEDYFIPVGFLRVTDFGIARIWKPDNAKDTSGTPGYMGR